MACNLPAEIDPVAYDNYVSSFTKPWNESLVERIIEESQSISGLPPFSILDVGTGTAHILLDLALRDELNNCQLIGVDYYEDMVCQAKASVKKMDYKSELKSIKETFMRFHLKMKALI